MQRDDVWYDDVTVLARRWKEFYPNASMSSAERTNAVVRFLLYATIATYLYNRDPRYVLFGFVAVALVSFLHPVSTPRTYETYDALSGAPQRYQKQQCKRSTPQNPFANFLLTDDPLGPPACAYDEHKESIRENFNRSLFMNAEDLWERQNSQRQFYTLPNSQKIPDTKAFAEFLSGGPSRPTCKTDPRTCTGIRS